MAKEKLRHEASVKALATEILREMDQVVKVNPASVYCQICVDQYDREVIDDVCQQFRLSGYDTELHQNDEEVEEDEEGNVYKDDRLLLDVSWDE